MNAPLIVVAVTACMIALTALYIAAEFATVSARKVQLRQEAEVGNRLARMLVPIVDDSHQLDNYIAACQIGITVASLAEQGGLALCLCHRWRRQCDCTSQSGGEW